MDKNILFSADGKTKIVVFDQDVEYLKQNGWVSEKKSVTKTKSKTED